MAFSKKSSTVFFTLSLFALTSISFAATATLDANVTIQSLSEITVKPSTLNWTDVALGEAGGNKTVMIENIGSENVTNFYVYPDSLSDESARPYGSNDPSDYSTGSLLTLSNESGAQYYFIGRLEWNFTTTLQNLNTTNVNSPVSWGFFKNTSNEYVWAVGNGSNALCNSSEAQFALDDDLDDGSMGKRTPETTDISNNYQDADFSYFSISRAGSPLEGHCVAVATNCDKIYIYKYDKRAGFTQCTNSKYISTDDKTSGQSINVGVDVFVPQGLPSGELSRATVTFVAS